METIVLMKKQNGEYTCMLAAESAIGSKLQMYLLWFRQQIHRLFTLLFKDLKEDFKEPTF